LPKKEITCHFCKETFFGYGHWLHIAKANACDKCNIAVVMPNRFLGIHF